MIGNYGEVGTKKMRDHIEKDVNLAFAMDQFQKQVQGNKSLVEWEQELRRMVRICKLQKCSCTVDYTAPEAARTARKCCCGGNRYTEDVAIRDRIVQATSNPKLRTKPSKLQPSSPTYSVGTYQQFCARTFRFCFR